VAAIYAIEHNPRPLPDIVRELRPVQDTTPRKPRPKPVNERAQPAERRSQWLSSTRTFERRCVATRTNGVSGRTGRRQRAPAGPGTRRRRLEHEVEATVVLDLIPVLEYLWKAAHCSFRRWHGG
jgi:hypothetical protein